jgi:hypothetical protein
MTSIIPQPAVPARPEHAASGRPVPAAQAPDPRRGRRFRQAVTRAATAAVAGHAGSVPF